MFTYVPRRVLGDSIAGPSLEFQRGSTSRRSCFQKTNTQIIGIKIKVPNDRALFVWLTNGAVGDSEWLLPCSFGAIYAEDRDFSCLLPCWESYFLRLYDRLFGAEPGVLSRSKNGDFPSAVRARAVGIAFCT